uniref:Uncharacterized protein n=1 Tax=Panagrolaimus davidi TaxID=227884 RepID=A0A914QL89_9BILA
MNEKCREKYGLLRFFTRISNSSGQFFVYSNNEEILNSEKFQRTALITPNSTTFLYFFSTKVHELKSDADKGYLRLEVSADTGPSRLPNVTLTKENPAYVLQFDKSNSALTVTLCDELKSENDVIETVHLPKTSSYKILSCFGIYYQSNFTNVMGKLYSYPNIITTQLTVYRHHNCTNENVTILFRAKNSHAKNCIFKKTAFEIRAEIPQKTSMIAKSQGRCYFVIVNQVKDPNNIIFTKIWTNSKKNLIEFYSDINQTRKLIEFK